MSSEGIPGTSGSSNSNVNVESKWKQMNYKIRASSKDNVGGTRASNLLESDMRTHWTTNSNAKEWVILELEETCLLTQIRIQNKSVSEWEISTALKNKPEHFQLVKSRCEAPRKEVAYNISYIPSKFVKIFCFRGTPIAIFYIQLMGIPVANLASEFQPVIDHLVPQIATNGNNSDASLKLLRDITAKLSPVTQHIKPELESTNMEESLKFLSALVGAHYPIVSIAISAVKDLESNETDTSSKAVVSISSNFKAPVRKSKNDVDSIVFQPGNVIGVLRVGIQNPSFATVARKISQTLAEIERLQKESKEHYLAPFEWNALMDDIRSKLAAEALLNILFACAADSHLSSLFADKEVDFISILPVLRVLSSALRPIPSNVSSKLQYKNSSLVEKALGLIITLTTQSPYTSLVKRVMSFLCSNSQIQENAAILYLDLSVGPLSRWVTEGNVNTLSMKSDSVMELITDFLPVLQSARKNKLKAKALILFIQLVLSGYLDNHLRLYLNNKHSILFLIELLYNQLSKLPLVRKSTSHLITTFDQNIISPESSSTIATISDTTDDDESLIALKFLKVSLSKMNVVSALEHEVKEQLLTPSAALSIIHPQLHTQLQLYINKSIPHGTLSASISTSSSVISSTSPSSESSELTSKYFLATELFEDDKAHPLVVNQVSSEDIALIHSLNARSQRPTEPISIEDYFDLDAEFLQLSSFSARTLKSKQFIHFAELAHKRSLSSESVDHSQSISSNANQETQTASDNVGDITDPDITKQQHESAIDSLLLAAECHLNPYFACAVQPLSVTSPTQSSKKQVTSISDSDLMDMEEERDKQVLSLLIQAAKWEHQWQSQISKSDTNTSPKNDLQISDVQSVDVVTLVRMNQSLLYSFLHKRLIDSNYPLNEVLLQGLIYVIRSMSFLPNPHSVVEVVLQCISKFNNQLVAKHLQSTVNRDNKEKVVDTEFSVDNLRRYWALLGKLTEVVLDRNHNLIDYFEWFETIGKLQTSNDSLVRFFAYKCISSALPYLQSNALRNYKLCTSFLLIFFDDLIAGSESNAEIANKTFGSIHPELYEWFPTLTKEFREFSENILKSILQLIEESKEEDIPDLLTWLLHLATNKFTLMSTPTFTSTSVPVSGFQRYNFNKIILTFLEHILKYHAVSVLPELPRLIYVILGLCENELTNVEVIERIFILLQPIFAREDRLFSTVFENVILDKLLNSMKTQSNANGPNDLLLFVMAKIIPELSDSNKKLITDEIPRWINKSWTNANVDNRIKGFIWLFKENAHGSPLPQFTTSTASSATSTPNTVTSLNSTPDASSHEPLMTAHVLLIWKRIDAVWNQYTNLVNQLVQVSFAYVLGQASPSSTNPTTSGNTRSESALKKLNMMCTWITDLQRNHHWSVAAPVIDHFIKFIVEFKISVTEEVLNSLVECLKSRMYKSPRVEWRQDVIHLSMQLLLASNMLLSDQSSFVKLIVALLEHSEQELRVGGLNIASKLYQLSHTSIQIKITSPLESLCQAIVSIATHDSYPYIRVLALQVLIKCIPMMSISEITPFVNSLQSVIKNMLFSSHQYRNCAYDPIQMSLILLGNLILFHAENAKLISNEIWNKLQEMKSTKSPNQILIDSILNAKQTESSMGNLKDQLAMASNQTPNDQASTWDPSYNSVRDSLLNVLVRLQHEDKQLQLLQDRQYQDKQKLLDLELETQLIQQEKKLEEQAAKGIPVKDKDNFITIDVQKLSHKETEERIKSLERMIEKEKQVIKLDEIRSRRRLEYIYHHERKALFHSNILTQQASYLQLENLKLQDALKEVERQKMIELEKEKTRELRYQMEMEAEKKYQKELETNRDSIPHSRKPMREYSVKSREKYREKPREGDSASLSSEFPETSSETSATSTTPTPAAPFPAASVSAPATGDVPTGIMEEYPEESDEQPSVWTSYDERGYKISRARDRRLDRERERDIRRDRDSSSVSTTASTSTGASSVTLGISSTPKGRESKWERKQ